MILLTIEDLKVGHYYRVVDPGNADPAFEGAIVVGCRPLCGYRAVTVQMESGMTNWGGAPWRDTQTALETDYDPDLDARFEEVRWPLPVWVMTNLSPEYGDDPPRTFRRRDDALKAARLAIEGYIGCALVGDQIPEVLAEFNNQADCGGNCGAGDSGALFYAEVQLSEVE